MTEPRAISKDAVPRVSAQVRRRRYGEESFLLRRTEIYRVDAQADAVWLACNEGLTVEQIAHHVAEREGLLLGEALAAAIGVLTWFEELGFVEL